MMCTTTPSVYVSARNPEEGLCPLNHHPGLQIVLSTLHSLCSCPPGLCFLPDLFSPAFDEVLLIVQYVLAVLAVLL